MGGFNSVLQSYLQQQQLKQQGEQFKQSHDLAQKQLEETAKFHQAEIDRMQNEFNLNKTLAAQQLRNAYIEHIAGGMEQPPGNAQPTGQQVESQAQRVQIPSDQSQPPSPTNLPTTQTQITPTNLTSTGYRYSLKPEDLGGLAANLSPSERELNITSPEERARMQARATFGVEQAKEQATLPGKKEIAGITAQRAFGVAQINAQARENATNASAAARIKAAEISGNARRYAADVGASGNAQELADAAVDASTGLQDLPSGKNKLHVESLIRQSGRIPFGKKDGDRLKGMNDVDGVFDDMRDAAAMLPDNIQGQVGNFVQMHLPIPTDLKNRINQVRARAPLVVRNVLGVQNRMNMAEINNALDGMVSGKQTKAQALDNISRLQRDAYGRIYNDILGGMPTEQKVSVLNGIGGGIDKWRGATINYKGQEKSIVHSEQGSDYLINPNTGKYENIDGLR